MNMRRMWWLLASVLMLGTLVPSALAFYDPGTQRWITRDPLGEVEGGNLSRFVRNNPIDVYDPTGLYASNEAPKPEQCNTDTSCPNFKSQWQDLAKTSSFFPFIGKATICIEARRQCLNGCAGTYGAGVGPGEDDLTDSQRKSCNKRCKADCEANFVKCGKAPKQHDRG